MCVVGREGDIEHPRPMAREGSRQVGMLAANRSTEHVHTGTSRSITFTARAWTCFLLPLNDISQLADHYCHWFLEF